MFQKDLLGYEETLTAGADQTYGRRTVLLQQRFQTLSTLTRDHID